MVTGDTIPIMRDRHVTQPVRVTSDVNDQDSSYKVVAIIQIVKDDACGHHA